MNMADAEMIAAAKHYRECGTCPLCLEASARAFPVYKVVPQPFHGRRGGKKCLCGSPSCPNPAAKDDP